MGLILKEADFDDIGLAFDSSDSEDSGDTTTPQLTSGIVDSTNASEVGHPLLLACLIFQPIPWVEAPTAGHCPPTTLSAAVEEAVLFATTGRHTSDWRPPPVLVSAISRSAPILLARGDGLGVHLTDELVRKIVCNTFHLAKVKREQARGYEGCMRVENYLPFNLEVFPYGSHGLNYTHRRILILHTYPPDTEVDAPPLELCCPLTVEGEARYKSSIRSFLDYQWRRYEDLYTDESLCPSSGKEFSATSLRRKGPE